ncbi:hypothetical protein ANCCAN_22352 [Ancylostoma caninum]|uniref:Uncharacterized protein n=1 Tax=Ancylostoma caninum TaxID=29170 RepID=A0A368FI86_ANCCA|nr:hypothetical protein ANCCAN_22352 [Ancylostoma caninum]
MDGPNHVPRESFGSLADEMADSERSEVMQLRLENRKLRAHLDSTEKYGIFHDTLNGGVSRIGAVES